MVLCVASDLKNTTQRDVILIIRFHKNGCKARHVRMSTVNRSVATAPKKVVATATTGDRTDP